MPISPSFFSAKVPTSFFPFLDYAVCLFTAPCGIYWESDQDYHIGLATIMREVIEEAEGIEFLACDDYDCRAYLVYPPNYPWNLRKGEENLTEEAIVQILSKYVNIVSDTEVDIEYQSIENCS